MNKETEEIKKADESAENITEEAVSEQAEAAAEAAAESPAEENTETAESKPEKSEKSDREPYTFKSFINDVFDVGETLILFMLVFFLLKAYVADQAIVDGSSMVPTLNDSEKLLYSKIYTPEDNDIVIADNERLGLIVKRIVATEGEVVDIRDGVVYVNGQRLDEQVYEEGSTLTASHFVNSATQPRSFHEYPCTVPEGHVFLMGDNRGVSEDSRGDIVGFVPVENIVGKVFVRYSPVKDFRFFNY